MKRRSFLIGLASALAIPSVPAVTKQLEDFTLGNATEELVSAELIPNTWNHVTLVRNAGTLRCYLNGLEVSDIAGAEVQVSDTGKITLTIFENSLAINSTLKKDESWILEFQVKPTDQTSLLSGVTAKLPPFVTVTKPKEPKKSSIFGKIPFLAKLV